MVKFGVPLRWKLGVVNKISALVANVNAAGIRKSGNTISELDSILRMRRLFREGARGSGKTTT